MAAKDKRVFAGFTVVVENPAGSAREWRDAAGRPGTTTLKHDYGYIEGSPGPDGSGFRRPAPRHPR